VNILVDEQFHVKLSDFGLTLVGETSTMAMSNSHSSTGTIRWKSPERLQSETRRSTAGDIWAFALLILVVCEISSGV
jgi:serine/threonine protein kinase